MLLGTQELCRLADTSVWHLTFLLDEKLEESCLWFWGDIRGVVKITAFAEKYKARVRREWGQRNRWGLCGAAPPDIFEACTLFQGGLR